MHVCDGDFTHEEIVHAGLQCPLCSEIESIRAREQVEKLRRYNVIRSLEKQIKDWESGLYTRVQTP